MKQLLIFLLCLFMVASLNATEIDLIKAIRIDTAFVNVNSFLEIEYQVIKPIEGLDLFINCNGNLDKNKSISLSGAVGDYREKIFINLAPEQVTYIVIQFSGKGFVNKKDSLEYAPCAMKSLYVRKQKDRVINYRTTYTEKEKEMMAEQKSRLIWVNREGKLVRNNSRGKLVHNNSELVEIDQEGKLIHNNSELVEIDQEGKIIWPEKDESAKDFRYFDPLEINAYEMKDMAQNDVQIKNLQAASAQNYTINISGKVYTVGRATAETVDRTEPIYGTKVWLYFINSSNSNAFYHPIPHNNQFQDGIHYSLTGYEGEFSFNFSVNADLSSYNQIILCVERQNEYIDMKIPGDHIYYPSAPFFEYYIPVFTRDASHNISFSPNISNISISNKDLRILEYDMGVCFTWMTLAGELFTTVASARPENQITVYRESLGSANGRFEYSPTNRKIKIDDEISTEVRLRTVGPHEYAHYLNYCMWGLWKYNQASEETTESWTMFYEYATRYWAYKMGIGIGNTLSYNIIENRHDNYDIAPFVSPRFSIDASYPAYARNAGFLWQLYDGHSFLGPTFVGGDNDDIAMPQRVFNTFRYACSSIGDFYNEFKRAIITIQEELSADEKASVDAIYRFIYNDNPSYIMRSNQCQVIGVLPYANSFNVWFQYIPFNLPNNLWPIVNMANLPSSFSVQAQRFKNAPWISFPQISYNPNFINLSSVGYNLTNANYYNYKIITNNASGPSSDPFIQINNNNYAPSFRFFIQGSNYVTPNQYNTFGTYVSSGLVSDLVNYYAYDWYLPTENGWTSVASSNHGYSASVWIDRDIKYVGAFGEMELMCVGYNYYTGQSHTEIQTIVCYGCWFTEQYSPTMAQGDELIMGLDSISSVKSMQVEKKPETTAKNEAWIMGDDVLLYPNPVSDILNINVPNSENYTLIEVFDALGRKVKSIVPVQPTNQIYVGDLPNGSYFLILQGETQKSFRFNKQ